MNLRRQKVPCVPQRAATGLTAIHFVGIIPALSSAVTDHVGLEADNPLRLVLASKPKIAGDYKRRRRQFHKKGTCYMELLQ